MTTSQSIVTPSTSSAPPRLSLPHPPPAGVAPQELVYKHQQFHRIEHAPSKRRGLEQSAIWEHGIDYECVEDAELHGWRCSYCFKSYFVVLKLGSDVTTNARRHLLSIHSISLDNARKRKRDKEGYEEDEQPVVKAP